jgi:hypothetical protein
MVCTTHLGPTPSEGCVTRSVSQCDSGAIAWSKKLPIVVKLFLHQSTTERTMIEFTPRASADVTRVTLGECALGQECDHPAAGHSLSFMQRRLAGATSTKWLDAIVGDVSNTGRVRLTTVADGQDIVIWHHSDVSGLMQVGEPVALHAIYHVLAVGLSWINVSIEAI